MHPKTGCLASSVCCSLSKQCALLPLYSCRAFPSHWDCLLALYTRADVPALITDCPSCQCAAGVDPASRPGRGLQSGVCLPTAQPQSNSSCPACTAELDREKSSSLGSVESANSLARAATAAGGEGVAAYARAKARLAERYAKMTRDAQRARLEQASALGERHQQSAWIRLESCMS